MELSDLFLAFLFDWKYAIPFIIIMSIIWWGWWKDGDDDVDTLE
jgi:hypothetical protein